MLARTKRIRRYRVAILLVLVLVIAYLFIFFGRRVALPNRPYVLVIQPGVSDASVQLTRTGLDIADQFLIDTIGSTLTQPAEVRLAFFSPCSPLTPIPQLAPTAQVVGDRLCINTHSGVWRQGVTTNPGIALAVIAHEHYHLVQHELGCLSSPWNKQYDWLIEGGASYVGWETVIAAKQLDRAWVAALLTKLRAGGRVGALKEYEHEVQGDAATSLAYHAVQQLVAKTGSPTSLNDFCARVGHGEEWHTAFAHAFGVTLADFYAEFEAAR